MAPCRFESLGPVRPTPAQLPAAVERGIPMTTDVEHVVNQLRRVGLRPSEHQWSAIREAGWSAFPSLLALASDARLLVGPEPAAFGPVHALRLLGEFEALSAETI